jgi:hypothetical protein
MIEWVATHPECVVWVCIGGALLIALLVAGTYLLEFKANNLRRDRQFRIAMHSYRMKQARAVHDMRKETRNV